MSQNFYYRIGKRLVDLAIAIPALIVLSPLLVVTAILVRIRLGSPVLFRQERPGFKGRRFRICKFRTMTDRYGPDGELLHDDLRLNSFGKFLRASSLDELPELWNVIVGEMSLVGPRPLRMEYLQLYSAEQSTRHDVMPGISGWAQVNGRNSVDWDERLKMDVWYTRNISLRLDLWILWKTISAVFGRKGISADGCSTMPSFEGTQQKIAS